MSNSRTQELAFMNLHREASRINQSNQQGELTMKMNFNLSMTRCLIAVTFCFTALCFFATQAQGAIMVDNPGTGVSQTIASNTLSIPGFTVGTGDKRMLVVTAGGEVSNGDILSVTYGSQSFTRGAFVLETGANAQFAEIWWLANPASGSNTITATLDASNAGWAISALSMDNVLQTGPVDVDTFGSTTAGGVSGNSLSLDVSGISPFVVEALSSNAGVTMSPTDGQSIFFSQPSGGGGGYSHLGATDTIFGGSLTSQGWTLSPTQRLAHVGVVFVGVAPIPEPSGLGLLGLGAIGLIRHTRRRRVQPSAQCVL